MRLLPSRFAQSLLLSSHNFVVPRLLTRSLHYHVFRAFTLRHFIVLVKFMLPRQKDNPVGSESRQYFLSIQTVLGLSFRALPLFSFKMSSISRLSLTMKLSSLFGQNGC